MKVKINFDKSSEICSCCNLEITFKFLKLSDVVIDDLIKTKAKEKNYKLVSVISYEILED